MLPLAESLDVRGAMSWSPDGKWIVVAADEEKKGIRVFKIPVDGGEPVRISRSYFLQPRMVTGWAVHRIPPRCSGKSMACESGHS